MPHYVYECAKGHATHLFVPVEDYSRITLCDKCGDQAERVYGQTMINTGRGYPMLSDAAGVNPSQIKAEQRFLESRGVKTEFTRDGAAIFRDRKHRKEHLRAVGMFDKSGGYGDAAPR